MKRALKTKCWITPHSNIGPEDLKNMMTTQGLAFSSFDMAPDGWTFVGDAEVMIEFVGQSELIDNKVKALKASIASIRAESTAQITRIESNIQQLLCIENNSSSQS